MQTALGSQPQAHFSTQSTIDPTQQAALPGVMDAISQLLSGTTQAAAPIQAAAVGALPGLLNYQAPQIASGQVPQINATQAFDQGVVQPVTQDFLQRTLPSIAGNYGRGAGGSFGSESAQARSNAATDTSRSLAQTGSEFALGAAGANQNAMMQSLLANLTAANQGAQVRNAALGLSPGTAGIISSADQPFLADLLNSVLQQTQQTSAVGTGGSTGLIQGLLSGPLASAGGITGGLALANALNLLPAAAAV